VRIVFYKSDGGAIAFFRKHSPRQPRDRRGRLAAPDAETAKKIVFLKQDGGIIEFEKYNPHHDPKSGRFTSGGEGGGGKVKPSQKVTLPDGSTSQVSTGTKITKVVHFAGRGTKKELRIAESLSKQYKNSPKDWSKTRGDGYVDFEGAPKHCELHWYESPKSGRVQMKGKRWNDES